MLITKWANCTEFFNVLLIRRLFIQSKMKNQDSFRIKHIPSLLVTTYKAWDKKNPFRLSAVIAYYAVLSLPALLVIIVKAIGAIWDPELIADTLTSEFSSALGKDAATSIKSMLNESNSQERGILPTIMGIGTLLYGATGLFYQLQLALNDIWEVEPDPNAKWWKLLFDRARSFTFILVIGFLLLISFVLTAGISALKDYLGSSISETYEVISYVLDIIVSLGVITLLFALMFKFLPDAKVRWRVVRIGAFVTAVLFVIGKLVLGYYFGETDPGSTYGAAGTIILILLWVSYSSLILFFGAEFTYIYAKCYGNGIEPQHIAKKQSS